MKSFFTFFICTTSLPAFTQTVQLNPMFGNAGIVITPNTTEINRIAIDPSGIIYSAGYSLESAGSGINHLTVTKNISNGTPVSNFGSNGVVVTPIDYSEYPMDIQLQPDGKILVSGSSYLGPTQSGPGDYRSFVVRYLSNGNLDNTFANNGIFKLTHSDSHIAKLIVLSDGSVLLAGNSYGNGTVSKINANGVPDPFFGTSGSKFLSDANFTFVLWDAILLADQTVLCVGYDINDLNNMKVAYCKIDLNGDFVAGFGQNGKVVTDLFNFNGTPSVSEYLQKVSELPNGQIIAGGQAMQAILMKINPDGSLDSSFGNNGILYHSYPYADFLVQSDGKFLIGGSHILNDFNAGFSITRLNSSGNLDNSFNGTGTFTVDVSTGNDYLQCMKPANNNHILVGGSSRLMSTDSDFMLADIDISQTLNLPDEKIEGLNIYPNPFTDELHISVKTESLLTVRIIDAAGRLIGNYPLNQFTTLSLAELEAGAYQLLFADETGNTSVKKLIKR